MGVCTGVGVRVSVWVGVDVGGEVGVLVCVPDVPPEGGVGVNVGELAGVGVGVLADVGVGHLNVPSIQVAGTGLPTSSNNVLGSINAMGVSQPSVQSFMQWSVSVPIMYFPLSNGGCGSIVEKVIHSLPS